MKRGYFKERWLSVLMLAVLLAAGLFTGALIWYVVFVVFLVSAAQDYRKFDIEEINIDKWYNGLASWEKKKLYENKESSLGGDSQ